MSTFNYSLFLIFCLQALLLMISIPAIHSRTFHPNDENLIQSTCKKTPNYNVCIQYLKSNPKSSNADVTGLALIMVNVIKGRATDALNKIHALQKGGSKPGLDSCASSYNAILVGDVQQATQALKFGDPKFAVDGANDAAIEADSCQHDFPGPLTAQNEAMHDVAVVTAAIARLLL
ncbi:hypothetical protein RIF29_20711 [Crotalaria pallida]|uniref:Pectinesterase inhibitor domain-containing protein n=1 Tax=Crotalaria pallida TaxID=3830 RepID=A0AAN9I5B2_CROPI